jgi:tetratricopeptide (TPR) repeat protein
MAYFLGDLYRLRNLLDFREARESVLPWVVNLGDTPEEIAARTEEIRTRYDAVSHSLNGDIFLVLDERERAIAEYEQALEIDPLEKNWLNTVGQAAQPGN